MPLKAPKILWLVYLLNLAYISFNFLMCLFTGVLCLLFIYLPFNFPIYLLIHFEMYFYVCIYFYKPIFSLLLPFISLNLFLVLHFFMYFYFITLLRGPSLKVCRKQIHINKKVLQFNEIIQNELLHWKMKLQSK